MPKKTQRILWKFQCKKWDFGFIIPDERKKWWGDFFVHKKNFYGAIDGQRVAAEILDRVSGSKPEAKITELFSLKQDTKTYEVLEVVEGVYSWWSGEFGFVDIAWQEEWYFVYGLKKNGAKPWDRVRADIKMYNGKKEAIITKILESETQTVTGVYSDNENFGFVKLAGTRKDVFIPGSAKADAQSGDTVEVRIIKEWWRRPEGIIVRVL